MYWSSLFVSSTDFYNSLIKYLYTFLSQLYNRIMLVCLDSCGTRYIHFINSLELWPGSPGFGFSRFTRRLRRGRWPLLGTERLQNIQELLGVLSNHNMCWWLVCRKSKTGTWWTGLGWGCLWSILGGYIRIGAVRGMTRGYLYIHDGFDQFLGIAWGIEVLGKW